MGENIVKFCYDWYQEEVHHVIKNDDVDEANSTGFLKQDIWR